jgi:hypothetical protein
MCIKTDRERREEITTSKFGNIYEIEDPNSVKVAPKLSRPALGFIY